MSWSFSVSKSWDIKEGSLTGLVLRVVCTGQRVLWVKAMGVRRRLVKIMGVLDMIVLFTYPVDP